MNRSPVVKTASNLILNIINNTLDKYKTLYYYTRTLMTYRREDMVVKELIIDREFKSVIPPLTAEELEHLERSLLKDGCRDPLVVWNDVLIDGHNRYEICGKHNLGYKIIDKTFEDRYKAINWIIDNQLARRNLTPEQKNYLIGKKYLEEKKERGGNRGNQYAKLASAQNERLPKRTAEIIADKFKMGHATVRRAGQYSRAMDIIAGNVGEDIRQKILARQIKLNQEEVIEISRKPREKQIELITARTSGKPSARRNGQNNCRNRGKSIAGNNKTAKDDIDSIYESIRRLESSKENEHEVVISILPLLHDMFPRVRNIIRHADYAVEMDALKFQLSEYKEEMNEKNRELFKLRERVQELEQIILKGKESCSDECTYTMNRLRAEYKKFLDYIYRTIHYHLTIYDFFVPRDRIMLKQMTIDAVFTFLSNMEWLEDQGLIDDKISFIFGRIRRIVQAASIDLKEVSARIDSINGRLESLGLITFVEKGFKKTVSLSLDKALEKAIMPQKPFSVLPWITCHRNGKQNKKGCFIAKYLFEVNNDISADAFREFSPE